MKLLHIWPFDFEENFPCECYKNSSLIFSVQYLIKQSNNALFPSQSSTENTADIGDTIKHPSLMLIRLSHLKTSLDKSTPLSVDIEGCC